MKFKVYVMRGLIEIYLFFRSFGYTLYVISWRIIRRIIGFMRRHGFRYKKKAVVKKPGYYYSRRSHLYDIKTARILNQVSRWIK